MPTATTATQRFGALIRSLTRWTSRSPASTARKTFSFTTCIGLPFGKGHTWLNHGLASWVVGNWQISGTLSRESGLPFGIGTTSTINAGGQANSASQINPNVQILGGHDANDPYFNGAAFANPPANVLGLHRPLHWRLVWARLLYDGTRTSPASFPFNEGKIKLPVAGRSL